MFASNHAGDAGKALPLTEPAKRVCNDAGATELEEADIEPRGADMTRILVVDDDPMVCMAIEVYLERNGFEVTIADGGQAGLRA